MSAATATTRPAPRPELRRDEARELRIVSMILNTRMAQTAFEIREQQLQLNELEAQSWALRAQLDEAASPSALEAAARANGMVPAGPTGFITLGTGTVEGGKPAQ